MEVKYEDAQELLTCPADFAACKKAIADCLLNGTRRTTEHDEDSKKTGRVSTDEVFTRLLYFGMSRLHLNQDEVWLMPFGMLLDLHECWRQEYGTAVPRRNGLNIDDIIPL